MEDVKWQRYLIGMFLSLGLGYLSLAAVDYQHISTNLWKKLIISINPWYLAGLVLLVVLLWLVECLRTRNILRLVQVDLPFSKVADITLATAYGTAVSPFGLGGPPLQAYLLYRRGVHLNKGLVVSTVQGVLTQIFLIPLAVTALFLQVYAGWRYETWFWAVPLGGIVALLPVFLVLLLMARPKLILVLVKILRSLPGIGRFLKNTTWPDKIYRETLRFRSSLKLLSQAGWGLAALCLYTALIWIIIFGMGPVLLLGFGLEISWISVVIRQVLVYFISTSLPLPGGSGVQEVGLAGALTGLVPRHFVFPFIAGWRLLTYYTNIILGLPALWHAFRH